MKRKLWLLVSFACFVSGAFSAILPGGSEGSIVAYCEAEHMMGGCADHDIVATDVCFGGCLQGGCGCVRIQKIVAGAYSQDPATSCGTASCTAPQDINNAPCGG
jgi:hypothetical protein